MKLLMILQLAELVSGQHEQSGLLQAHGALQGQMRSTQSTLKMLKMLKGEGKTGLFEGMGEEEKCRKEFEKSVEAHLAKLHDWDKAVEAAMGDIQDRDDLVACHKSLQDELQGEPSVCPKEVEKIVEAHFAKLHDWEKAGEATMADIQDRDDLVACRKLLQEGLKSEPHGEPHGEPMAPHVCPKEVEKSFEAHFSRLHDRVKAGEATVADIQDRDDLVACRKFLQQQLDEQDEFDEEMTEEEQGEGGP